MPYELTSQGQRLLSTGPRDTRPNQQSQQTFQQFAPRPDQFVPKPQDWDYQTATVDMQGNPLPKGALQFDPYGRPYFGPGPLGALKRYAHEFTKDVDAPTAEKWDEIKKRWQQVSEQPSIPSAEQRKTATQQNIENLRLIGETFSTAWQAGESQSLLSIPLKAVRVGTTALMEGLSEFAIKTEQTLGTHRAIMEGGEASGMKTIDFKNDIANLAANIFIPGLGAYNAYRFFKAPGTVQEKKELIKQGWDEGRLLYTSFVEPAVRQEYQSRVKAGEDPYLLAMELENPFAEMAGQLLLDPLNLLGALGKGGKVGRVLDDAADLTRKSALVEDAADIFRAGDVVSDVKLADKITPFAEKVRDFFYEGDKLRSLRPQSYKPTALNASGNRTRLSKQMGEIFTWMSQNLVAEGRPVDDIMEYMSGLVKLSSKNIDEVRDGVQTLSHFPSPSTHFGEAFLETSSMLRNIIGEEKDVASLVKKFEKAGGDWDEIGKIGRNMIEDAAKTQYPTIGEMRKASDAVDAGQKVTARTQQLAQEFKELAKTNPGLVRLSAIDELASKPKNAINKFLGNFYFSFQYGVAARNAIQNELVALIDAGPGAVWRGFKTDAAITEKILATHGGQLPPSATGFQTLRKTMQAGSDKFLGIIPSGSKIMEDVEISTAKRIYWKYYRDTITNMAQPGKALPDYQTFRAAGFTDEQVGKFTRLVHDNYGDIKKATQQFNEMFKGGQVDAWRLYENYLPKHVLDGLDEIEAMDELADLTRLQDVTRDDIIKKFDDLVEEVQKRAKSTVYDSPGQSLDAPGVKVDSDWAATTQKYTDAGTITKYDVLKESGDQAVQEYMDALWQAVRKHAATTGDQAPLNAYRNTFDSLPSKTREIESVLDGKRKNAWAVFEDVKKGKENPVRAWDKLGIGPAPEGLTADKFGDFLWSSDMGWPGFRSTTWEQHATEALDMSEALARQFGMEDALRNARSARMDFERYRTAVYTKDGKILDILGGVARAETGTAENANNIRTLANRFGVATATAEGTPNDAHVLNIVNKYSDAKYDKLDDVDINDALRAFKTRAGEDVDAIKLTDVARKEGTRLAPPYPDGKNPGMARAMAENVQGHIEALQIAKQKMLDNFGVLSPQRYDDDMVKAMKEFTKISSDRMAEGRLIAQRVGQYWRDFALLPYGETTHLDHAMSYIFPYQFWYSRSYATWVKRLASDPQIVAAYAKLKTKMAKEHKEAPEWWKYNVQLPEFMWGLNNNNPMYINLEAAVWPLYGITGTDFNEPKKRVDWLTATVDDMGKFGPSVWAPIQLGIAAMLQSKDQDEAARYWGSRLIPQTAAVKSVMALMGKTPIELDPAVQQFSGEGLFDWTAQDPYEERRTGRQLGAMQAEGYDENLLTDAAFSHSGPLWDEAYRRATELRAPGQLASHLFGVGFKARTPEDIEIDNFYNDMHRLMNMKDVMSPENYTNAWDQMRETYPFLDVLLLSRKAGDMRDEAYAWNVINRIPPGQSREIFTELGLNPDTVDKFYENKGDMTGWSDAERERFMQAMVEAGAILSIPQDADREEWDIARDEYKNMQNQIKDVFGGGIQFQIDHYFEYADRDEARQFMEDHPEVGQALDLQNQLIMQNPVLMKYYGGIDVIERYYRNQMYDELEKRYGEGIGNISAAYSDAKYRLMDKDLAKEILNQYPQLRDYWSDKDAMQEVLTRQLVEFGSKLPEQPAPEFRRDFGDLTPEQQAVMQQQAQPTYGEFARITGQPIAELVEQYLVEGEELPKAVIDELDYLAPRNGYGSGEDMLVAMGIAYYNR